MAGLAKEKERRQRATIAEAHKRLAEARAAAARQQAKESKQQAARLARIEETNRRLQAKAKAAARQQMQESERLWSVAGSRETAQSGRRMRERHQQHLGERLSERDTRVVMPGETSAAMQKAKEGQRDIERRYKEQLEANPFHIPAEDDGEQKNQEGHGSGPGLPLPHNATDAGPLPDIAASDTEDTDPTGFQDCSSAIVGTALGVPDEQPPPCTQAQQRSSGPDAPETYFDCLSPVLEPPMPLALPTSFAAAARTAAGLLMESLWQRLLLHCLLLGLPLASWTWSALLRALEPHTWLAGSGFVDGAADEFFAGVGASGWVFGHDTAWLLLAAAVISSASRSLRPLAVAARHMGAAARGLARRARRRLAAMAAAEGSSRPQCFWAGKSPTFKLRPGRAGGVPRTGEGLRLVSQTGPSSKCVDYGSCRRALSTNATAGTQGCGSAGLPRRGRDGGGKRGIDHPRGRGPLDVSGPRRHGEVSADAGWNGAGGHEDGNGRDDRHMACHCGWGTHRRERGAGHRSPPRRERGRGLRGDMA